MVKNYTKINKYGTVTKYERFTDAKKVIVTGNPDPSKICTSYVERQNLTMGTFIRRFTRDTIGFSKKFDNHCYTQAPYFVWYNFVRIHKSLRVTPAMAAGLTKRFMTLEDIAKLIPVELPKKGGIISQGLKKIHLIREEEV